MNDFFFLIYLFLALFVVVDGTLKLISSIMRIKEGALCVQYFFYFVFYIFFIVPMVINLVFAGYQYEIFWQANEAMRDYLSMIIYAVFVYVFSFFIYNSAKKDEGIVHDRYYINLGVVNICTVTIIVCFLITIAVSGIQVLTGGYGYAYINKDLNVNEAVIGCGVVSYLVVLAHIKLISRFRLLILTFIVLCFFWIVGKRYIIAETLIMCICVLGMVGVIDGKKMVNYLVVGGVSIVAFGFLYGVFFKENVTSIIDYLNIDFSRQYTLVYQFYCDRIGRNISINKFDGVVYLVTFFIPRLIWEFKPYPFVNYLTLSLTGQDYVEFVNAGFATTCSIFSDLFDSFGYLGILLGIYLFVKLFHKANNEMRVHYKVITIYICVKLITVQLSSSIVQITVVLIILFLSSIFTKNIEVNPQFELYEDTDTE